MSWTYAQRFVYIENYNIENWIFSKNWNLICPNFVAQEGILQDENSSILAESFQYLKNSFLYIWGENLSILNVKSPGMKCTLELNTFPFRFQFWILWSPFSFIVRKHCNAKDFYLYLFLLGLFVCCAVPIIILMLRFTPWDLIISYSCHTCLVMEYIRTWFYSFFFFSIET